MEGAAILSTPAFMSFDKGLRARAQGDQLSAIVAATSLLKENPFPSLVNQVAVRLAEVFKDGNNQLRTCIARVLSDSSEHLSLIFSSEEVLKRIFAVSHSNDPRSRALTLEVLGSLAPIYSESKKVHHLILESLTAEDDFEFECATHAMMAFAKISTEFAGATVERLSLLMTSSELSMKRKALLIPTIGTMKSDVRATKECFALERFLLDTSANPNLICSLLSAMTSLAQSTRYTVPEQVEILLIAAIHSDVNLSIRLTALTELVKLAKYAHVWDESHLKSMHELKLKVEQCQPMMMSVFLKILIQLSSHFRLNHATFFEEILFELGYLFTAERIDHRILGIQFACNCYVGQPSDSLATKLVRAFTITTNADFSETMARRFFHTMAQFMCSRSIPEHNLTCLLNPLLEKKLSHKYSVFIAQLFCRVCNSQPSTVKTIHSWVANQQVTLEDSSIFTTHLAEPLVFLYLAPSVQLDDSLSYVAAGSDWDRYAVARTALRNGHWKLVAAPNLEAISTESLSVVQKLWIEVLRKLADSQLTNFSATAVRQQRDALTLAQSKATELVEFSPDPAFVFLKNLCRAMLLLSNTIYAFFSGTSLILQFDSNLSNNASIKRVRFALENCSKGLHKCEAAWTELYRNAFTADATTLDYLSFVHTSIALILSGVKRLLNDVSIREILLPNLLQETTTAQLGRNWLFWAKGQVDQLGSFQAWKSVVENLLTFRQCVPRFIFHQEYQFEIKLSICAAVNGEMTVQANHMVPIQIDGFIRTNHPSKVDSVIVTAGIYYLRDFGNNTSYTSSVKLNGETHFSAQMMISFRQSCNMEFSIEFVDSQKRTWSSSSKTKVKVNINE